MKYIPVILSVLIFANSTVAFAALQAITAIEVSTDSQTVAPNVVSGKITVSLKNANGGTEEIDESSNKLSLTSSSPTGEFSSNADTWKKTNELTVNKNTASRGFYYKDSAEGTHTLFFVLTSGETGIQWSTTHPITIGSGGSADVTGDTSTTTATTTTTTDGNVSVSSGGSSIVSSHESSAVISRSTPEPPFSVSAGRERLGNSGAPLFFHAVSTAKDADGVSYRWSFGDGTSGTGALVTHQYKMPGVYTAVLIGTRRSDEAASRTRVRITAPDIQIVRSVRVSDGALHVVVRNNDEYECNIGRFAIRAGSSTEILAPDTIIPSGSEIPIATRIPYQEGLPIFLTAPSGVALNVILPKEQSLQALAESLHRFSLRNENLSMVETKKDISPPYVEAEASGTSPLLSPRISGESQHAGLIVIPKDKSGFFEKLWDRLRRK